MAEIMTESQLRRAKRHIAVLCANWDKGTCLMLGSPCPQCVSYTLLCNYFKEAVLPDKECAALQKELSGIANLKKCSVCGAPLPDKKKNTKFCVKCAGLRARQSKREWAQRNSPKNRKS